MTLLLSASATAGWAQSDVRVNEWSRGTTLGGFAGVATDTTNTGPAIGGAVGWDLTPRFAIEGSGSWMYFGESRTGFAGAVTLRTRLAGTATRNLFATTGAGLYMASFADKTVAMPEFYSRRISPRDRMDPFGRTFTDPSVVIGGGASFALTRHLSIRPEVRTAFVLRNGRSNVLTSAGVHVVYHFENHSVTPASR
jgi:hypothetical protein